MTNVPDINKRKMSTEQLDAVLMERCRPWIESNSDDIHREAALDEFVSSVVEIIEADGQNAWHRHDVVEQAVATIKFLVNHTGRGGGFNLQEVRTYMVDQFQGRLLHALLDQQYNNSLRDSGTTAERDIRSARERIRTGFGKIINLDETRDSSTPTENGTVVDLPQSAEQKETEIPVARIQLDFSNRREGIEFAQMLGKKVKKIKGKYPLWVHTIESGPSVSAFVSVPHPTGIQRKSEKPAAAMNEIMQPMEYILTDLGYEKGNVGISEQYPEWHTAFWKKKNAA